MTGARLGPIAFLCFSTSFLSQFSVWAAGARLTELSAFHGCGLVNMPALGSPLRLGAQVFSKLRFALFFIFLVI